MYKRKGEITMYLHRTRKFFIAFFCLFLLFPNNTAKAASSNTKGIDVSGKYNGVVD